MQHKKIESLQLMTVYGLYAVFQINIVGRSVWNNAIRLN